MSALRTFARVSRAALVGAGLLTLAACASASKPEQMTITASTVPAAAPGAPGYKAFRVAAVQGGGETNPLWMSNVSDKDFKVALETSLKGLNYLADSSDKASLELKASIVDLQRPMAGIDMSVTSKVRYSAIPVAGGAPVFDDTVAATGTAHFGESLLAVERLRKANEAAMRANIEAFVKRLQEGLKTKGGASSASMYQQ